MMTRKHLLCLFMLVALAGVSCSRGVREGAASAEQIAYLQAGLNPAFKIRRASAVRDEHGMQAYDIRAEIVGPGLENGVTLTWRVAGTKQAPRYALITSPVPSYGIIRWTRGWVKTVEFQPTGR